MQDPNAEVLPFYGFYNVKAQNGFSSYDTYGYLASYIESTKAQGEELREALKNELSEEEFQPLLEEQRAWIRKKEAEVEEAGKEVEGGSLYPLITYTIAADLTEERTYELYEMLK